MSEFSNPFQTTRAQLNPIANAPGNILGTFGKSLSKIEPHEEAEARAAIDAQFTELTGKPLDLQPAGYFVAMKVWVPEDHIKTAGGGKLYMPEKFRDERKYTSGVALVCALGPDAYKGDRYKDSGSWCKVGDWVMFQRYEAIALSYRGVAMALIPDDRILAVISDPAEIDSINSASKL
jgi:co-chaperonin GroES (HSP10)